MAGMHHHSGSFDSKGHGVGGFAPSVWSPNLALLLRQEGTHAATSPDETASSVNGSPPLSCSPRRFGPTNLQAVY
jgi:hypothetical protein